ncbi:CrcB family protein [Cohnella pontilimi]|uniref:Fluoride-specific ion channel FluC n=1 Tax=Cohnella pontilimi TaxID=2564100 RepID=A0A4U0FEN1_9BACL|nr:CrcB family protein [Cohnella pontilimi]TJY43297.1 CrcB family protein [Cohnella pontilimi]
MILWHLILVGVGGSAGAVLRYGVARWFANRGKLPIYATLTVNLAGSFAMGVLIGARLLEEKPDWYALMGTGVLGGLTTYSTLNVQKALLVREGAAARLGKYAAATYVGGWLLTALGIWIGRASSLHT